MTLYQLLKTIQSVLAKRLGFSLSAKKDIYIGGVINLFLQKLKNNLFI